MTTKFTQKCFSLLSGDMLFSSVFFFFCAFSFAQELSNFNIPDSLQNKSFDELMTAFASDRKDSVGRMLYAKTYVKKALKAKDRLEMTKGYELLAFTYYKDHQKSFMYYDKAIELSKDLGHKRYPAILYTFKGAVLSVDGKYEEAMENHIKALEYAEINANKELTYVNKHNIGILKKHLELYDEALQIFKECYEYELKDPERDLVDFVYSHFSLATIYLETQKIDSAIKYNTEGYKLSKQLKNYELENLFLLNRGVIFFHQKKYNTSISYLKNSIDSLKNNREKLVILNGLFHIAKSYDSLQKKEEAILYYKKIDSIYESHPLHISSNVMNSYKALYTYYKEKNDKENEILYVKKALEASDVNKKDYRMLSTKIIKTFDRKKLLQKQKELSEALSKKDKKFTTFTIVALITSILFLFSLIAFYLKQRKIKQRFKEFVENHQKAIEASQKSSKIVNKEAKEIGLAADVIDQLLKALQNFEEKHIYIKSDITLPVLSKRFKTNSAYLSKVVNTFKNKKFAEYLNDLRIDYAIEKMQSDKHFRLYTIKAIALEVGFNNSQSFARAFRRKTGIKPSDFIKQLESIST